MTRPRESTQKNSPPRERTPAGPDSGGAGSENLSPPYGAAALAGLLVFGLYALTLAPTTAFWDTSEYIATGEIMGIPHPPGNPLFVVLARAWSILLAPLGLSAAVKINLFSAFVSAGAHGLWFLVVHHILRFFSEDRFFRFAGASAAVLVSATAFTVWNQSNVNEKVYTVSLLTIAILSWLLVRWQENLGKGKDDNLLVLMAFVLALSVGNHLMAFLAAPAIGLFILYVHPQTLLNWRLYVAGAGAMILGLTIHLFLPIRAGLSPVINEAAPTCPDIGSAIGAVVTYGKAGCTALSEALNRTQYSKPPLVPRQAPLPSQFANYLQYFDWQWARSIAGGTTVFAKMRLPFTMLFTGFGVWGAIEHFRRDKASFLYVATLFGTVSVALIYYLNFKYGYSLQAPVPDRGLHEVRERDYFFVVSFSLWGLWAGMGIATLWQEAARETGATLKRASPILLMACLPLFMNWGWATRTYDYSARDWAHNLLMSVEPYGVLFTNGDNDTFPLWYLQEVEGIRRDVTVIVTSYLNTDWYTKQLRDLTAPCEDGVDPGTDWTVVQCQRPYSAENTSAAYVTVAAQAADKTALIVDDIRSPTRSILRLTDEQIDEAAVAYSRIDDAVTLQIGNIQARLAGGQMLAPWQRFALSLMVESIDDRPIYFASSGNAAISLGVQPYLVRQGLAFKLHNGPIEEGGGFTRLDPSPYSGVTGDWLDEDRTRTLMDEVFVHRGGIPDGWDHWPDLATVGIPNYYSWVYTALMQAANQSGDDQALDRYRLEAESWLALGTPSGG
jgi:transmembrane protein TMEM260 (protein O-mannosyltransferase)